MKYISLPETEQTNFLREVNEALKKLGFKTSLSGKNLYIYSKNHIDRFFKEIKPANHKHVFKYRHYKKHGSVPLTKNILNR